MCALVLRVRVDLHVTSEINETHGSAIPDLYLAFQSSNARANLNQSWLKAVTMNPLKTLEWL